MGNSFAWLLEMLKKQGLSFVLLGAAVWYFYGEVQRLENKADICQDNIIDLYQNVILQNTEVMKQVNQELDETQKLMRYLHNKEERNK